MALYNEVLPEFDRYGAELLGISVHGVWCLGLDLERFALELPEHTHAPRVREDFMSGVRSGVNGTPTFFINGVRHNGGYDLPSLLAALRESLASAA